MRITFKELDPVTCSGQYMTGGKACKSPSQNQDISFLITQTVSPQNFDNQRG
jgi:hypothetical protein